MILDSGICKVFRKANVAAPGAKPTFEDRLIHEGWYGELNFETAPANPTPDWWERYWFSLGWNAPTPACASCKTAESRTTTA